MMLVQHVKVSDAVLKQCGAANEKNNLYVRLTSVFCQSECTVCICECPGRAEAVRFLVL